PEPHSRTRRVPPCPSSARASRSVRDLHTRASADVLAEALSRHLPDQRERLYLSFALADAGRLEALLVTAGFRDRSVTRQVREGSYDSSDAYWAPIEEGAGSLPQAYRALPESSRREVRREVQARLAPFESSGRLEMTVEMLIGTGQA